GFGWSDLSGAVPDADDTPGAILALGAWRHAKFSEVADDIDQAIELASNWLFSLRNRDGGIPTFCRGWGKLPFDRSGPDLTAHALRAWSVWLMELPEELQERVRAAISKAVIYLSHSQRPDGSWAPLWFGNQHAPDEENPTYGTARVVLALQQLSARDL